jgi:hypothetical protein
VTPHWQISCALPRSNLIAFENAVRASELTYSGQIGLSAEGDYDRFSARSLMSAHFEECTVIKTRQACDFRNARRCLLP